MKLLTVYSDSHENLFDTLRDSIELFVTDSFDFCPYKIDQTCPSGIYNSEGFWSAAADKFQCIHNSIDDFDNEVSFFVDADVVILKSFVEDVKSEMHGFDMKFQRDAHEYCTGVFAFRRNEEVKRLLSDCIEYSSSLKRHDQTALNALIHQKHKYNLSTGFLNEKKYVNPPLKERGPYSDVITFHANFIVGIDNKLNKMLEVLSSAQNELN